MRRNLYRLSALLLAALISAVALGPAPAGAAASGTNGFKGEIPCPTDPNIRWEQVLFVLVGYQYSNISATSTFFASDGRTVENGLDQTISATFTSSKSLTTSVTVSVGSAVQLTEQLKFSIDTSIVASRTTAIGVNATLNVPPRTRTTGLYGVHGYNVTFDALKIHKIGKKCYVGDGIPVHLTTKAPTYVEGWQFSSVSI
jgi:hypothetical protein